MALFVFGISEVKTLKLCHIVLGNLALSEI
jgi:hypothetical protein